MKLKQVLSCLRLNVTLWHNVIKTLPIPLNKMRSKVGDIFTRP